MRAPVLALYIIYYIILYIIYLYIRPNSWPQKNILQIYFFTFLLFYLKKALFCSIRRKMCSF